MEETVGKAERVEEVELHWPWLSRQVLRTPREVLEDRQARMNTPEVRARAKEILDDLAGMSTAQALGVVKGRIARGVWDGIAWDLAGLRLMKPNAAWGEEVKR